MTLQGWWILGALLIIIIALAGCDPVAVERPVPAAIPEPGPAPRFPALDWQAKDGLVCIPTEQAFDLAEFAVAVETHDERMRVHAAYWRRMAGGGN